KGLGRTFVAPRAVVVEPHGRRTTFLDWPERGREGRYEDGAAAVVATGSARLGPSESHRASMPRLRWRSLDGLYFFGYALATYLALPFLLASTRFVKRSGSRIVVDFPDELDTHGRRQAFVFDDEHLLVRHDYTADVVGAWAMGSHYSSD